MKVTTEKLKQATPVVKIRALCLLAKLNHQTINSKIRNDRELTEKEAQAIGKVARAHGINFLR